MCLYRTARTNGQVLFTATIDPTTGKWVSQQYGPFEVSDDNPNANNLSLKIVTTDGDGDTTSTSATVPCSLPVAPT